MADVASDQTTVAGLIEREHRRGMMGRVWIGLTLVALAVVFVSAASLWPSRALTNENPAAITPR